MSGDNPYAPPAVAESQVPSTRYWYLYGTSLIVRHGATLPKIDLDTGVSEGPMKVFPRTVNVANPADILKGVVFVACYLTLRSYFNLESFGLLLPLMLLFALGKRIGLLRGSSTSVVHTSTFVQEKRAKKATLRRQLRIGVMLLIAVSIVCSLFLTPNPAEFIMTWIRWVLPGGMFCIIALTIWAVFDRPKTRTRLDSPGWLRISRIHPDALTFLRGEEEAIALREAALPAGRKRLVRTVFLHRFPLRMLIGRNFLNPLIVIRVALMKILRSRLLVREVYHFSEAEDVPLDGLSEPLRQAAGSWRSAHPDWTAINSDRLTSPAGDLVLEAAMFASPGLEHCARINRAWMQQKPDMGETHFTFTTWLMDGTHASTLDQPFISFKDPQLHHRASGSPESIYQAHLRHIANLAVSPSRDIADLLERVRLKNEEADRLMTEAGYQSEVREAN